MLLTFDSEKRVVGLTRCNLVDHGLRISWKLGRLFVAFDWHGIVGQWRKHTGRCCRDGCTSPGFFLRAFGTRAVCNTHAHRPLTGSYGGN